MTFLERLPAELLEQILKYLLPDEVDNFINSREEFHDIASRILPRHNKLKEKYSLLSCRYGAETRPITLLRDIFQDPEIIWYVKTIDLELSDDGHRVQGEEDLNKVLEVAVDCQNDIMKTVRAFLHLDDDDFEPWADDNLSRYRNPTLALLVCSLTCLESIWIRDSWKNQNLHRLVRKFGRQNCLKPGSSHPFGKVNHVEEGSSSSEDFMPMESFEPFSRLPSMRRYTGRYLYHQRSWTPPKQKSTITSLELYECMVLIGALRSALSGIANLEKFIYECYWSKDGPRSKSRADNWKRDWQVGEIILSLLESARHSLIELDLTRNGGKGQQRAEEAPGRARLCWEDGTWIHKDMKNHQYESEGTLKLFIGSLRGFLVLKYIRLQSEAFVEEESVDAAGGRRVHRLVDLLPASMETMTLASPQLTRDDSIQLLEGLPELKTERVPKLEMIDFESDWHSRRKPNKDMKLKFLAGGIDLVL